ncbi:hypothetical protein [Nostoc sp.]
MKRIECDRISILPHLRRYFLEQSGFVEIYLPLLPGAEAKFEE